MATTPQNATMAHGAQGDETSSLAHTDPYGFDKATPDGALNDDTANSKVLNDRALNNEASTDAPTEHPASTLVDKAPPAAPHTILASRYHLQTRLGTGAYGDVYTAWDEQRACIVAIKVLRNAHANALMQFKHEFRGLFELNHPNLIRVFKLGRDGELWFIVMEYIDGHTITDASAAFRPISANDDLSYGATTPLSPPLRTIDEDDTQPLPITTDVGTVEICPTLPARIIRDRIGQLAQGVYTLHLFGILHCDLKPSNVMLTASGRVVILDFGASRYTEFLGEQYRHHWVRAGTRAYMAPEARTLRESTPGLDWFSVGMMLAEMLTGLTARILSDTPHSARTALLHSIAAEHPAYASLARLCIALLCPDPAERADHNDVFAACYGEAAERIAQPTVALERSFVSSSEEWNALQDAYDQFVHGRPCAMLVEGPTGAGKRALCETFLRHAALQDDAPHILVARCVHHEMLNYRAFDELVDGICALVRTMKPEEIQELLPLCTPTLCALFPTLQSVHKDLECADDHAKPKDALFALQQLLHAIAAKRRLLVWVADIDQADRDSLRWIARIFAPGTRPHAFLLLSKTNHDTGWHDAPVDLDTLGYAIPTLRLKTQDEALARHVIQQWLPQEMTERPQFIEALLSASRGNLQILRALCAQPHLLQNAADIPTFEQWMTRRLASLPPAGMPVLEALCVSFEPIGTRMLAYVSKRHPTDVDKILRDLAKHAFVVETHTDDQERYAIVDEDTRRFLRDRMSESRVLELHQHYATAISRGAFRALRPTSIVAHFTHAQRSASAEKYALHFAQTADRSGAYDSAAQMYEWLLQLRSEEDEHANLDLQMRVIDCNVQSGRLLDAAKRLAHLAAHAPNANDSSALHQRAAELYTLCGYTYEAHEEHAHAREKHPDHQHRYLPRMASIFLLLGKLKKRLQRFDITRTSNEPLDTHTLHQLRIHRMAGFEIGIVDPVSGLEFALRELDLALNAGSRRDISRALAGLTTFVSAMGEKHRALAYDWGQLAEEIAAEDNDNISIEWARVGQASIEYHQSNYREAWERIYASYLWLQQHASQQSMMLSYCSTHLIYLAYMTGRLETLRSVYYSQIVEARARNNRMSEATITFAGFITWLMDDAPEAGRAVLQRIHIPQTQRLYRLHDFFIAQYSAELALYEERTDEYSAHIQALKAYERTVVSRSMELTRHAARFLRGRLLIAQAQASSSNAKKLAKIQKLGRSLCKDETALVHGWGRQLLAAKNILEGNDERAAALLQKTIEQYDEVGVHLYAAILRAAGHAHGLWSSNDPEKIRDPYVELRTMGLVNPERFVHAHLPCF